MARQLTSTEKKELRSWAKHNSLNLDYNKKLDFGHGFWQGEDIASLKAALLDLQDASALRQNARIAVGEKYVAYDVVAHLGNENGLELIGYEGKEYWINFKSLPYVNGYLAIPKLLLK